MNELQLAIESGATTSIMNFLKSRYPKFDALADTTKQVIVFVMVGIIHFGYTFVLGGDVSVALNGLGSNMMFAGLSSMGIYKVVEKWFPVPPALLKP